MCEFFKRDISQVEQQDFDIPKRIEFPDDSENRYLRAELPDDSGSIASIAEKRLERNGFIPRSGGEWTDEPGNSTWKPDLKQIPLEKSRNPEHPYSNPEHLSWEKMMQKYKIEGIPFKDGEPDFSEVERGAVEIDDFTDDRSSNFEQADEKMAEQRGCTPEEVENWRKENNCTWHECQDCKTMRKVPNEIHANIPHSGGVSEYKAQNKNA